jgi:hypothetical protein
MTGHVAPSAPVGARVARTPCRRARGGRAQLCALSPGAAKMPVRAQSPFSDGPDRVARRVCVHPGFAISVMGTL